MFFSSEETLWSHKEESVLARKTKRFGAIVIEEKPLPVRGDAAVTALCKGLRQLGWRALPLPAECQSWLDRLRWAQQKALLPQLPDCSETALLNTLEIWLAPFLGAGAETLYRRSQLTQVDWHHAIRHLLSNEQLRSLEQLAPSHITVPTGSHIALDYSGEQPVLAVRLQEMFGLQHTPCIANGSVPVLIHLLSPAKQPLAVTQDLASFWQNAYKDVRKDMRGQYKRHYWPENPLEAEPTRRTKAADDRARKS